MSIRLTSYTTIDSDLQSGDKIYYEHNKIYLLKDGENYIHQRKNTSLRFSQLQMTENEIMKLKFEADKIKHSLNKLESLRTTLLSEESKI